MTDRACQQWYERYRLAVDATLRGVVTRGGSQDLSNGAAYVLAARGKRVRAVLLLLACKAVGGRTRDALHAGAAMEILHNFTLVHDDIMDNATTRRGRAAVHIKWNLNTALLVGDTLVPLAYQCLLKTKAGNATRMMETFTRGFLTVCEGQALDLVASRNQQTSVAKYFSMIEKKTAGLFSTSTELGGVIGGGTTHQIGRLGEFGRRLGRAFQLQDDLLDVTAQRKEFGKTIGGDIIEGKQTFLLLTTLERATARDRAALLHLVGKATRRAGRHLGTRERRTIVDAVTKLYRRYGALESAEQQIRKETELATRALGRLPDNDATEMLHWLSRKLLRRIS